MKASERRIEKTLIFFILYWWSLNTSFLAYFSGFFMVATIFYWFGAFAARLTESALDEGAHW